MPMLPALPSRLLWVMPVLTLVVVGAATLNRTASAPKSPTTLEIEAHMSIPANQPALLPAPLPRPVAFAIKTHPVSASPLSKPTTRSADSSSKPASSKAALTAAPQSQPAEPGYRKTDSPFVEERSIPEDSATYASRQNWTGGVRVNTPPGVAPRNAPRVNSNAAGHRNKPTIVQGGPYGGTHALLDSSWQMATKAHRLPNGKWQTLCEDDAKAISSAGDKPKPQSDRKN